MKTWLFRLSLICTLVAFSVVLLGAFTRLTDAGLGCPDWPGCYGQLRAPDSPSAIAQANADFPAIPVHITKARTEMTHRYFAETLGSLILLLGALSFWKRRTLGIPTWLPPLLVGLVIFQGLLGMWTVTLKLWPIVVMAHLLGGLSLLGLLWLCVLILRNPTPNTSTISPLTLRLSYAFMGVLVAQILLGGWTSANYAALICPDFPTCQGQWWPENMNFIKGFHLTGGHGMENPLFFMDTPGKTAIHMMHRIGAFLTLLLGLILSIRLFKTHALLASTLLLLLCVQVLLGISNVLFYLPLHVALTHHGVAALLLLTVVTIQFMLRKSHVTHRTH